MHSVFIDMLLAACIHSLPIRSEILCFYLQFPKPIKPSPNVPHLKWTLYIPVFMFHGGLTSENYTFCPHSVFKCFVRIWEQTAIISLYSINWLVFITETECVYLAVRTVSLNTIKLSSVSKPLLSSIYYTQSFMPTAIVLYLTPLDFTLN
jgi:hypothetical protein